jgi:hypothetical protein
MDDKHRAEYAELVELAGGPEALDRFVQHVTRAAFAVTFAIRLVESEEDCELVERIRQNIRARELGTMGADTNTLGDTP